MKRMGTNEGFSRTIFIDRRRVWFNPVCRVVALACCLGLVVYGGWVLGNRIADTNYQSGFVKGVESCKGVNNVK